MIFSTLVLLSLSSPLLAVVIPQNSPPPLTTPSTAPPSVAAAGRYIVKFKTPEKVASAAAFISSKTAKASRASLATVASAQGVSVDALGYGVRRQFQSDIFSGLTVTLDENDKRSFAAAYGDHIEYMEPDKVAYATNVRIDNPPSWGQLRVATWEPFYNLNAVEFAGAGGSGVDVYVLDTGITPDHPSFEGRAKRWKNYVKEEGPEDKNGHGTHVAGTIASSKYGIARNANVYGVKVLNADGSGLFSRIIAAMDDIAQIARPCKTVINLSLSGEYSKSLNDAMEKARKKGIIVVVAAGNDHINACQRSPASSVHVLTVGASDEKDQQTSFSNYGKCVDIFAPGSGITSLDSKGHRDEARVLSGTSMAAPHVAAVCALYMSMKSYRTIDELVYDIQGWSHEVVGGTAPGSGRGLVFANPNKL